MQQNVTSLQTPLIGSNSYSDNSKKLGYIVAVISEFAKLHDISVREAANYLVNYKGIDFLSDNYEAEHLLSIEDSVDDATQVCLNNGGNIK